MLSKCSLSALFAACLLVPSAQAHVTLERQEAAVGGGYKAVFRVPHGCGNSPTLKFRVRIPEGVVGVKPMLKPGWQLETVKAKYDKPYGMYHGSVTEGVREVTWTGNLPDENYDEFILSAYLTDDLKPNTVLYFPTVQECENGVHRWIEVPAEGKTGADYKEPAPGLKLLPKK
ncbi:YcnI family copper-binding membrane protein [Methylorubrum extorquens]|uniref:YcnI family copper-binding membrane protein n=1 Tax=Methylorubrum extorquens TaxID=408 RepID=UPI001EE5D5D7|nr:YcnI family protein [Methylorubrum extorquens]MCG5248399.1 YcnI family protein [Methylorubrum extorquens]